MYIRFATPDLPQLDSLRCDALALPFFSDERPLQGVTGLVDWRLCGLLSRWMAAGRIRGTADETVLVPGAPRLSMDTVWLFGLGAEAEFTAAVMRQRLEAMLGAMGGTQARSLALVLPGRNTGCTEPSVAMEALVAAGPQRDEDELVVLDHSDAQKAMEPVIARERRRQRARDYA